MRIICFFGILIILFGCSQEPKPDSIFEHNILLEENIGKYTEIGLSSIVSELEYIPLETKKSSLMGGNNSGKIIINNDFMFIGGYDYLYVFCRNGKFINQIGSKGRGPGEYIGYIGDISINESEQTVFVHRYEEIFEYTWNGKYLRTIPIPKIDEIPDSYIKEHRFVEENIFIGYIENKGSTKYRFCLFDDKGEIIKLFPNTLFFPTVDKNTWHNYQSINIYKYNDQWYLKESVNDTLLYLNGTELVPFVLFDSGKYQSIDKITKDGISETEQTISVRSQSIINSSDFIFFGITGNKIDLPKNRRERELVLLNTANVRTTIDGNQPAIYKESTIAGVYDMKNKKTTLLENDPCGIYGFINDLDGGLPFWPRFCTDDNKLVSILSAEDLKGILTEEYFAAHEIKDIQAHQRLRDLLKNLKEDDNPVVVIATLK